MPRSSSAWNTVFLLALLLSAGCAQSRLELTSSAVEAYRSRHDLEALGLYERALGAEGEGNPEIGAVHIAPIPGIPKEWQ